MLSSSERALDVCIVTTYDITEDGGVKQNAFTVAEALRRRGDRVVVLGASRARIRTAEVYGAGGIVSFHGNGSDNAFSIFANPFALRRFFSERRFDVIHVHEPLNPMLGYWAAWLAPRTPHVATFHAFGEREPAALKVTRALTAPLVRGFYQRAFAVSEPARRWAAPSWKRPIGIIPNGIALGGFRPGKAQRIGPVRLLFVGRLDQERKGFAYLLEAFRRLQARGLPVTLDVVGDGAARAGATAMPGVTYHGRVTADALVEHYRNADIFVAPSTGQESFGIVLLEAMATARPIICSGIAGYRQVVDSRGALFVPPMDAGALEDAIARLAAAPTLRQQLGAWNRQRALGYDWERLAKQVRHEYLLAIAAQRMQVVAPLDAEPVVEESEDRALVG